MKKFAIIPLFIIIAIACKREKLADSMYQVYVGNYYKVSADNLIKELDVEINLTKDSVIFKENDSIIYQGNYTLGENKLLFSKDLPYYLEIDKTNNKIILQNYVKNPIQLITYSEQIKNKVSEYATVKLYTDISHLSNNEKKVLSILFDVAKIMDDLYWQQVCPQKDSFLNSIKDENVKKLFLINYGPYEQLRGNKPFIPNVSPLNPKGTFYPLDMTKEEFEKWDNPLKSSWYTIIRRDNKGNLIAIPYSEFYKEKLSEAADLLDEAAKYEENATFKKYLTERAKSFRTNDYFPSDMAWMDLKNNNIDFVVGPIENYVDEFLGYKTAFEAFILLKDHEWTQKLQHYIELLPKIQENLPVSSEYKKEKPAKGHDLGVYEAIYYAGDCNSGAKSIAINLPNDKKVNELKGSRKLQLKNTMKAKFENILVPISKQVIDENQLANINFDSFFENVMFHEIAHGLGISKTIKENKLVTDALKETHTTIEEAKADILGLYFITWLFDNKYIKKNTLLDNYVTFIAGIFRSVRFGAASAHGKANMIEFNYLMNKGAFTYNDKTEKFTVDLDKMKIAVADLVKDILTIQGDGDYNKAKELINNYAVMKPELQNALTKIAYAGIPRDIIFEQGKHLFQL